MFLNKAIIIGNLTRDPELKSSSIGNQSMYIQPCNQPSLERQEWCKAGSGRFHNIVAFGRQAEIIAQYLKKGSSALIEGRMQTRSWEDKGSGEKKYRTEIVADTVQFGSKSRRRKPIRR
jgi:single-strand DNA-binding protein